MSSYWCLSFHLCTKHMNMHFFPRNFATAAFPLLPIQLPSKREAHIWYILPDEVKGANLQNQYLNLLSPCEKENIMQMNGGELRKRALLARVLVRTTISRYLTRYQIDPQALKFRKNKYGKPEIGIDVEEKTRKIKNNILAFAKRYFSPNEIEVLTAISDPERQRQEFLKLWTLKEAYVKALGRGFSGAPFKTFTIQFNITARGFRHPGDKTYEACEISVESSNGNCSDNFMFALMELSGSHHAAICMEKDRCTRGEENLLKLNVWRTIPLVVDECVSGTKAALAISGFA